MVIVRYLIERQTSKISKRREKINKKILILKTNGRVG
jgi:hypothetical protein